MSDPMKAIGIFFVLGIIILVYFFPTITASSRKHNNASAIGVLNLFLGWTFLGWVIALVWAFTDNVAVEDYSKYDDEGMTRKEPSLKRDVE